MTGEWRHSHSGLRIDPEQTSRSRMSYYTRLALIQVRKRLHLSKIMSASFASLVIYFRHAGMRLPLNRIFASSCGPG